MQRYSVSSSNIASVGYDAASETLEVEFLDGSLYQYYNVPENMYDRMMAEGSKGRFLHAYIKNAYPYSRVG
ncbi:MAG: KTSC domain-containing protein [Gammaproteobacteria bacterium]|nr:KTSC domain-containing protein [Gammaproteobacteria bacterium]MDE0224332.1 KTSC domain-containing protein [Gammaproteobacteria bacterium]MDE0451289.1 KTSC domain-containing protein [Gammaproteobacteria bacterium]